MISLLISKHTRTTTNNNLFILGMSMNNKTINEP